MKYWNKICGFAIIFFICAHFCNAQTEKRLSSSVIFNNSVKIFPAVSVLKKEKKNMILVSVGGTIGGNYYLQHLGFFCKKELMLEKAIKIPIRIRLGSLQQCNYLEGKK